MEIAARDAERPVAVRQAGRPGLTRARLAGDAAERTHADEREARERGRRVFDRIARARRRIVVVDVAGRRVDTAERIAGGDGPCDVDERVVLAADRDRAESRARESDERLASEHAPVLSERAGVRIEAVFDREDRLQAAAEILRARHPRVMSEGVDRVVDG